MRREINVIRNSLFFDTGHYLERNPDVRASGMDPLMEVHKAAAEPWRVTLVDTGEKTMIGGRIKRILPYLGDDKEFCLTYGDGVGDIDVCATIDLHHREGCLATVSATQPPGRFGGSIISATALRGSRRSRSGTGAGSTAAFSSCRRRSAGT